MPKETTKSTKIIKFVKNEIYIFRLSSGDTLIGKVVDNLADDEADVVRLNKPGIVFTQTNTDPKTQKPTQQVGIAPYSPFTKGDTVGFYRHSFHCVPEICGAEVLRENYKAATTNIITPNKAGLIV